MIYFTADPHFGHEKIIKLNNRPFSSVEERDEVLIQNWNSKVNAEDTVYILGDICYKSKLPATHFLKRLNGHKHLIIGNHDRQLLEDPEVCKHFESIEKLLYIQHEDTPIILCHYPMLEWGGYFSGALHIHGHIHNVTYSKAYEWLKTEPHAFNAGVDVNNFEPVTLEELIKNKEIFYGQGEINSVKW